MNLNPTSYEREGILEIVMVFLIDSRRKQLFNSQCARKVGLQNSWFCKVEIMVVNSKRQKKTKVCFIDLVSGIKEWTLHPGLRALLC